MPVTLCCRTTSAELSYGEINKLSTEKREENQTSKAHLFHHPGLEGRMQQRAGEATQHPARHEPAECWVQEKYRRCGLKDEAGCATPLLGNESTHDLKDNR